MMILGVVVFLFHLSLTNAADTAVSCLHCGDVAAPSDCRDTMVCGKGEICYTREFTDHRGLQAFSLGCEVEARCTLFLNAQHLFGKRDSLNLDAAPSGMCYECCKDVECNGDLCQGKVGVHVPLSSPTTTSCPTITCPKLTCPTTTGAPTCPTIAHQEGSGYQPFSVAYKNKYYFFSPLGANWDDARDFCKKHDADLVSINSQDEQEFLMQHGNITGCKLTGEAWTGGSYSHSTHEWEWVDRSPVLYTHWISGNPGTLSHDTDYHIAMYNPSCYSSGEQKEGRWFSYSSSGNFQFICEKQKM